MPHNDVLKAIRKMEPAWEKTCGCKFALTSRTIIQPNALLLAPEGRKKDPLLASPRGGKNDPLLASPRGGLGARGQE